MAPSSEPDEEKVARDVLEYFLRNPQSADSLEGIARWRLLEQAIHRTLAETETALQWLVREGFLKVISVPGSKNVYALNLEKREEAKRFISCGPDPTS
jgi:hypothetical protein